MSKHILVGTILSQRTREGGVTIAVTKVDLRKSLTCGHSASSPSGRLQACGQKAVTLRTIDYRHSPAKAVGQCAAHNHEA